jgi:hypothetical protein
VSLLNITPKIEPESFAVGDTVEWTRQIDDFPATTYTLKYVLQGTKDIIKFSATSDGTNHLVSLTSAVTVNWTPGSYRVNAYVVNGTGTVQRQVPVAFPVMLLSPNIASNPNGADTRTFAEKGLAQIEATILALTNRSVAEAEVNGQKYTLANISDLFMLRERFRSEVSREQASMRLNAGLGAQNKIAIRFRPLVGAGYPPYPRVPWQ